MWNLSRITRQFVRVHEVRNQLVINNNNMIDYWLLELIDALRKNEEELVDQSWMEEKEDVHPDMIKGLMQCFDDAGLL